MIGKEGVDGEKDALRAYRAAREENENANEEAEGNEVSSALIDRVSISNLMAIILFITFCTSGTISNLSCFATFFLLLLPISG